MSVNGQVSGNTLKGYINRLTELRGYSAYEIAVIHGFIGTEEEWVNSISSGGGVRTFNGREGYIMPKAGDYTAEMVGADKAGTAAAVRNALTTKINANEKQITINAQKIDTNEQRIDTNEQLIDTHTQQINTSAEQINTKQQKISTASISLAANWAGKESPYSQVVTGFAVTATEMVDLQPTPEQIGTLIANGTAGLQAVNDNGSVTVYAYGEKPAGAMTIQATLTEVV